MTWLVSSSSQNRQITPQQLLDQFSKESGFDNDVIDLKRTVISDIRLEEYYNSTNRAYGFAFEGELALLTSDIHFTTADASCLSVLMPKTSTPGTRYAVSQNKHLGHYSPANPPSSEDMENMIERIHIDQNNRCTVEPDNVFYPRIKDKCGIVESIGNSVVVGEVDFKNNLQDHFFNDAIVDLSTGLNYAFKPADSKDTSEEGEIYVTFSMCIGVVTKNVK